MKTQALIAHILNYMNGEIHGRIPLQKLIYFCKAYGTAIDANYRLYIYGPYSQQVAASLQEGGQGTAGQILSFYRRTNC